MDGVEISSIAEIGDLKYLVACRNQFEKVVIDKGLFKEEENVKSFLKKRIEACKIECDRETIPKMPNTFRKNQL